VAVSLSRNPTCRMAANLPDSETHLLWTLRSGGGRERSPHQSSVEWSLTHDHWLLHTASTSHPALAFNAADILRRLQLGVPGISLATAICMQSQSVSMSG
jgi:hypothetical protein